MLLQGSPKKTWKKQQKFVCLFLNNVLYFLTFSAELGDYNPDEHMEGYLSEFRFTPTQSPQFEAEVQEWHKQHK